MNKAPRIARGLAVLTLIAAAACNGAGGGQDNGADEPETPAIGELGGMCGGIAGFQCKTDGAYCAFEPGVCRDGADYAGVCTLKPEVCTMDYRPVCGCDGETYGNACAAAAAGASVAYEGACEDAE